MIGIIGGAGVAATNKLLEIIEIQLTRSGAFRDCHHPEMMIYQATRAPSRSMYLEGRGESFIPAYIKAGLLLKAAGATRLCMCCNTAHYAVQDLSRAIGLPFINLIEEVGLAVKRRGVGSIGLIASEGCLRGKVYERYMANIIPHVKIIYPGQAMQKLVTDGICNIKNCHRFDLATASTRPQVIFGKVCDDLLQQGAEVIVIGCTDIRVDFFREENIDSLEILAKKIIAAGKE